MTPSLKIVETLKPPFFSFVSFYFAIQILKFGDGIHSVLNVLLLVWVVYQAIHALGILSNYILKKKMSSETDPGSESAMRFLNGLVKGILWALGILLILQNSGVNVTSLIAGLGVGGIAIAFCASECSRRSLFFIFNSV